MASLTNLYGLPQEMRDIFLKSGTVFEAEALPAQTELRHLLSQVRNEKPQSEPTKIRPGIERRANGLYYVRVVRKVGGKRVERKASQIKTLREAQTIFDQFTSDARIAAAQKGKRFATFGSALAAYFEHAHEVKSVRTVEDEKKIIPAYMNHFMSRPLKSITTSELRTHLSEALKEKAISTRKSVVKQVRNVFSFLVENDEVERNPLEGFKCWSKDVERSPQVLSLEETTKFLREAYSQNHPWADIWYVTWGLGLRSAEAAGLKWTDIDLNQRVANIQRQALRSRRDSIVNYLKDKEDRKVPIGSHLLQRLMMLKAQTNSEFVLPYPNEWARNEAARVLRSFLKSIGLRPIRLHDLRGSFITQCLVAGVSPVIVMKMVGHSDLETTKRYLDKSIIPVNGATEVIHCSRVDDDPKDIQDMSEPFFDLDFMTELKEITSDQPTAPQESSSS